ncbi:tumor necrosis factor receptor superfamily member 1B [Anoplopoma fimbria]|uniref:tumor necrosis factor receptor superfamily member 1B n=1 Tax=Anoplopoma fimbria TaxID=229290 RepID=UPI0023EB2DB3|nr:tumor necrosis factor receptor superfamily member 1B [Anoplopoma fimbria]
MKDIFVLLVLLNAQTLKVCSQPYQADSDGNCLNSTSEYRSLDDSNLCCKKCSPGQRLSTKCNETMETVCEPCPAGQYMDSWNYAWNCFSCAKCKPTKGLQEAQSCSSTARSRCVCQPGKYCNMEFDDPFCSACIKYKLCRHGFGVSVPGKGNADVKCERCPSGTYSNTVSSTDPCQPHTICHKRVVVKNGTTTSDTVCGPELFPTTMLPHSLKQEPRITVMSTVPATSASKAPHGPTDTTLSISTSFSDPVFNFSTKTPPPSSVPDSTVVAVIAAVSGLLLFFIAIILLFLCRPVWKKDAAIYYPKVDANGNCESGDKINQDYLVETQLKYITVPSPEQQCLLQRGEASSDHSQCSNNTETLIQTDGSSSQESIGPLQSTVPLHNPPSALSEPMPLLSNTEPFTPQPSVQTQFSSQPTSPQVISPVTTSPHVNVNITFHIENRSCGTPSVIPTDSMQVDSKLPFGEEEQTFSIPQQEAGKQSLMSVQESETICA